MPAPMSASCSAPANATLSDPIGISSQSATNPYSALFGGVQAGWEYVFPSRLMLGIEADFSFPNYEEASKILSYRATPTGYASEEYECWRLCAGASATTSAPGRPT